MFSLEIINFQTNQSSDFVFSVLAFIYYWFLNIIFIIFRCYNAVHLFVFSPGLSPMISSILSNLIILTPPTCLHFNIFSSFFQLFIHSAYDMNVQTFNNMSSWISAEPSLKNKVLLQAYYYRLEPRKEKKNHPFFFFCSSFSSPWLFLV